MDTRRAAPLVFAALCLGLSAFVLRGQIAAHPKPPPDRPGLPFDPKTWHIAAGPARQAAVAAIGDQLAALNAGDADRAWSYQSRGLRRNFRSAQEFEAMITSQFPEFGHAKAAAFGPVWSDATGDHADVVVTVRGRDGKLARGYYWLIREDGGYHVAGVQGGQALR